LVPRTLRSARTAVAAVLALAALTPVLTTRSTDVPAGTYARGLHIAAGRPEGAHVDRVTLRPQPDELATPAARRRGFHHRVYLARVDNKGDFGASDAQLDAAVDQVLHRWVVEADGAIASFRRAGSIHDFSTSTDCHDGTAMWSEAAAVWPHVNFRAPGNHLVVLAPPGCDFGIGTIGRSLASGGEVEVRYDPHYFAQDLMHELGHNFSLEHADAQICDPHCTLVHYGDRYSFMGASIYGYEPPALESIVRSQLGIAQSCELPPVRLAGGQRTLTATYDLFPRTGTTGTRGLRVRDPLTGRRYWIDWRSDSARDAQSPYGPNTELALRGSTVRYDSGIVLESRADDGDTYVLSYPDGGGFTFAREGGERYTTPDQGMTVQVDAIGPHTARVTVQLSDPGLPQAGRLRTQRGQVVIRGSIRGGETVTAEPLHGWTNHTCYRYRWFAGGTPIPGARARTFTVPRSLHGAWLSVHIVGQRPGYAPRRARSEPQLVRQAVKR
jgi:hypothetical protein